MGLIDNNSTDSPRNNQPANTSNPPPRNNPSLTGWSEIKEARTEAADFPNTAPWIILSGLTPLIILSRRVKTAEIASIDFSWG